MTNRTCLLPVLPLVALVALVGCSSEVEAEGETITEPADPMPKVELDGTVHETGRCDHYACVTAWASDYYQSMYLASYRFRANYGRTCYGEYIYGPWAGGGGWYAQVCGSY